MRNVMWFIVLAIGYAQAQSAGASAPDHSAAQKTDSSVSDLFPPHRLGEKVGLVRGVLNRIDPVYGQLVIQTFGGRSMRIAFDGRTKMLPETANASIMKLPAGSVVSIDTVTEDDKLFAQSVRTSTSSSAELSGQVVRFDPTRSRLTLRDPVSPEDVTIRVTPTTTVIRQGQSALAQTLSSGMLIRVWFSATQNTAEKIEIVAAPGNSFIFEGRIIAIDLRSHVVSLSNDTDQSLRELTFGTLDSRSLAFLREGAEVSIQAEFDGEHYNIREVAPVLQRP